MRDALFEEIDRVSREGLDPALFERQRKASLGGRIRALGSFRGLAASFAAGHFTGYQPLDSFRYLDSVTCEDATSWIRDNLIPERFSLSIIHPKEA